MAHEKQRQSESPPPTYEEAFIEASPGETNVGGDGRIDVNLGSRLSRTLSRIVKLPPAYEAEEDPSTLHATTSAYQVFSVRLNVVIQVVGSRGDVQPFVALGNALQRHNHRVRLATHEKFRSFVTDSGLEFYSIGGNPEDLMAYMVKNPGLVPSMQSLRAGDIARKREMIAEMLEGCWRSCIDPDEATGIPFVADAIIANPPSFAHIHCAEALGIPMHMVFTMPWTGTTAFAHPLANLRGGQFDPKLANYISYVIVGWMTWQGLGDIINAWRRKLGLESVPVTEAPMLTDTLKVPHTYCWSPALVPKPADWASHIDISGFFFRERPEYQPSKDLQAFLDAGPPPVYIGFGSIVLEDAAKLSTEIVKALTLCGQRAIISPGWSRLHVPEDRQDLFCVEECPHEWLFQQVSIVVHHGGAGTTAIGLREARPTIVVPFFGDQPFWGSMVARAGAGPEPIPQRHLTAENLAAALRHCQSDQVRSAARELSAKIKREDGVQAAVRSFHANLPRERLQCEILPRLPASWSLKLGGKRVNISRAAAEVLVKDTGLNTKNLKLYRSNPILIINRRWDPATGTASSVIGTYADMIDATSGIVWKPLKELQRGRLSSRSSDLTRATSSPPLNHTRSFVLGAGEESSLRHESSSVSLRPRVEPGLVDEDDSKSERIVNTHTRSGAAVAGSMFAASGKSVGKVFTSFTKGFLVDMPLATAEGFRSMPRLWGDQVRHYGTVTDWQSGTVVAGKTFVQGVGDGLRDIVVHPVRGAHEDGALGAAKGVATGAASLLSKVATGGLGLVAYPGQGISKSLHTLVHSSTAREIAKAKLAEGGWSAKYLSAAERLAVVDRYHDMQLKM